MIFSNVTMKVTKKVTMKIPLIILIFTLKYGLSYEEFWVAKTNEDSLYAVIYSNADESNYENDYIKAWASFIQSSHSYLKRFDIQVGFVDCSFLSKFPDGSECQSEMRVDNRILFFE